MKLSKHKLELEADRYGLHFFGALPYEDETKSFDKVKISKKPIHIAIARELIVVPKEKKDKSKKEAAPAVTVAPKPVTATPRPS